ncbi:MULTISPECIES: hypothetical protein [unclassified Microcoleus]|uniref:hypothetical protein n=1 Tax=unclassified Microcoleus TaxID=2642155 RepID=UPI001E190EE0|nr:MULTISPECIES: hypothetical protein [unclassified Microcoleus]MCC3417862.1 hypothetical protein [Microcoleus sp. PH2017_07_MST_O_A]MCC3414758.1 hypothetical protein [Microcoleus sp. PH2017_02_FOX_O_A]MCC3493874.1 hypothetical protein [Microcoleus sp. PH2017_16_JOR_D_A]MCC3518186.1 hypothetical protein [Microcoleus sp. PH2017_18_LLB_O_A]MCC3535774.1 hypothetical protein [Microcoleus sp. PH2017_25_DOB_D_A]
MSCSAQRSIAIPNTLKLPVGRSLSISVLRSHLRVSILIVIRRVRSLERAIASWQVVIRSTCQE